MDKSLGDELYDPLSPCDTISPCTTNAGSLLDELFGDEVAMPPPDQFDEEIERSLHDYACSQPLLMSSDFDPFAFNAIDWASALSALPPSPPFPSPCSSASDDSGSIPLSPTSDTTLVSDFSPSLSKSWLLSDDLDDGRCNATSGPTGAAAAVDAHGGFEFTFEREMHVSQILSTPASPFSYSGYGLQPQQHDPRVAAADAHSLRQGMTAEPSLHSPYTIFPPQPPSPAHAASPSLPVRTKRATSIEDIDEPAPARPAKRRRPSTEQFKCSQCDTIVIGRSHNLKAHIAAKHEDKRPFACEVAGCTMAFARKHDRTRHFQSKHTTRGSPRKKAPARA
ncbi:hypothetical protein TRAPUB_11392 [Trametes pubescens]|uniref:C2H2-type domain-containing protein n=1 Tax=Trametes pubescens TaxID=154538 RepID=A0A1M2VWR6_TRAPU|nr:hypothetical protein TRAPUB_11392 [Trametes pubescens]